MIDISKLLRRNDNKEELQTEFNIKEIEHNYDTIMFEGPIIFSGIITNINKIVTVEGDIEFKFKINCYSCNDEFEYMQKMNIKETFMQSPNEDEYPILSEQIDLEQAIKDNLILRLPTRFLCKEDCKGICQDCGKNLNNGKCNCTDSKIDPRFEKLRQLLK